MISLVLGHFFGGPGIPVKQDVGGILCTRFFLVDLAAAPWSPYEIDKSYPLFRWGNQGIGPGTWDPWESPTFLALWIWKVTMAK